MGLTNDGGGVWRRTRKTGVVGFGYPNYPAPQATKAASTEDTDMTPEQAQQLAPLASQLVTGENPAKAWGWPTFAGGTNETLAARVITELSTPDRVVRLVEVATLALLVVAAVVLGVAVIAELT